MVAVQSTSQPAADNDSQTQASYSLTELGLIAGIPFAIGLVTILIGVGIGVCLAKQVRFHRTCQSSFVYLLLITFKISDLGLGASQNASLVKFMQTLSMIAYNILT